MSEPAPPFLRGNFEHADHTTISGWAFEPASPDVRVPLSIDIDGHVTWRVVADLYRGDLEASGIGDGRHGFVLELPYALAPGLPHAIEVRRASDAAALRNSPRTIEPVPAPPARPDRPATAPGPLRGSLDVARHDRVAGWALDGAAPNEPVALSVTIDGRVVGRVLADDFRADLLAAGLGEGNHGYSFRFAELSPLVPHELRVSREADGADLPDSPRLLAGATDFDADAERDCAKLLTSFASDLGESRALAFLVRQTDLLLARHADRDGGRDARHAQAQLRRRWGPLAGPEHGLGTPANPVVPRALVIDDNLPDVTRDAGSVAILSHMRTLAGLGYAISFVAAHAMPDGDITTEGMRVAVCGAPFYCSVEDVLKRQASCFDLVYVHRQPNAERYLPLIRLHQPKARVVFSVADLHYLRLARQAEVQRRPELLDHSHRIAFAELTAARMADDVITFSPVEAALLLEKLPRARVHVVPWAVPPRPGAVPFGDRADIAFIGGVGHPPNPDAVFWLTREIMPLVWARNPAIRCQVVGHGWTAASLPPNDHRIDVVEAVADLAETFARVRLTVAPLRYGSGIKGKVLESLAAGVPCVMSPIAAEGIALPPPLHELVADGADALARTILRFYADADANRLAAAAGLAMIAQEHSEQRVTEAMAALLAPA